MLVQGQGHFFKVTRGQTTKTPRRNYCDYLYCKEKYISFRCVDNEPDNDLTTIDKFCAALKAVLSGDYSERERVELLTAEKRIHWFVYKLMYAPEGDPQSIRGSCWLSVGSDMRKPRERHDRKKDARKETNGFRCVQKETFPPNTRRGLCFHTDERWEIANRCADGQEHSYIGFRCVQKETITARTDACWYYTHRCIGYDGLVSPYTGFRCILPVQEHRAIEDTYWHMPHVTKSEVNWTTSQRIGKNTNNTIITSNVAKESCIGFRCSLPATAIISRGSSWNGCMSKSHHRLDSHISRCTTYRGFRCAQDENPPPRNPTWAVTGRGSAWSDCIHRVVVRLGTCTNVMVTYRGFRCALEEHSPMHHFQEERSTRGLSYATRGVGLYSVRHSNDVRGSQDRNRPGYTTGFRCCANPLYPLRESVSIRGTSYTTSCTYRRQRALPDLRKSNAGGFRCCAGDDPIQLSVRGASYATYSAWAYYPHYRGHQDPGCFVGFRCMAPATEYDREPVSIRGSTSLCVYDWYAYSRLHRNPGLYESSNHGFRCMTHYDYWHTLENTPRGWRYKSVESNLLRQHLEALFAEKRPDENVDTLVGVLEDEYCNGIQPHQYGDVVRKIMQALVLIKMFGKP